MSDSESEEKTSSKNDLFLSVLRELPILLHKSQKPSIKVQKAEGRDLFISKWKKLTSDTFTHTSLCKKLNNMRSRVLRKMELLEKRNEEFDYRNSGALLEWEKEYLDMIDYEGIRKGKGNNSYEEEESSSRMISGDTVDDFDTLCPPLDELDDSFEVKNPILKPPSKTHSQTRLEEKMKRKRHFESLNSHLETEETCVLSTDELKRLLLLEQLDFVRAKKKKIDEKLPVVFYNKI